MSALTGFTRNTLPRQIANQFRYSTSESRSRGVSEGGSHPVTSTLWQTDSLYSTRSRSFYSLEYNYTCSWPGLSSKSTSLKLFSVSMRATNEYCTASRKREPYAQLEPTRHSHAYACLLLGQPGLRPCCRSLRRLFSRPQGLFLSQRSLYSLQRHCDS